MRSTGRGGEVSASPHRFGERERESVVLERCAFYPDSGRADFSSPPLSLSFSLSLSFASAPRRRPSSGPPKHLSSSKPFFLPASASREMRQTNIFSPTFASFSPRLEIKKSSQSTKKNSDSRCFFFLEKHQPQQQQNSPPFFDTDSTPSLTLPSAGPAILYSVSHV